MEFGNLIVRPFQLAFVAVVLGLSISLVKGQFHGTAPAILTYSAFCGAFGALAMIVGFAAVFVSSLQGVVMLALDGLSTLFFFAGSIALAVKLGVHSCSGNYPPDYKTNGPNPYCAYNPVIAGGSILYTPDNPDSAFTFYETASWYISRCRKSQALDAFLFLSLVTFIASLGLDLLASRKKSRTYA